MTPKPQRLITIPCHKSTVCMLRTADLFKYVPRPLILEGFKRGKAIRRRKALEART